MTMICCPFKTSYGSCASCLMAAIERKTGSRMQWVGSNSGCGDPVEVSRQFQTERCDYFEMPPIITDFRSQKAWKRRVRAVARNVVLYLRDRRYANLARHAEIVHFQQILTLTNRKLCSTGCNVPRTHCQDAGRKSVRDSNRKIKRGPVSISEL
jgi:hypothetical protein